MCFRLSLVLSHAATEKHVDRSHHEIRKEVTVRQREEKIGVKDTQPRLFGHLTNYALLGRLANVAKSARQVERAARGIVGTTADE